MVAAGRPESRNATTASSLHEEDKRHQPWWWSSTMCAYARTNVETPHVLETPPVIAAAKNPRPVVGEGDRVRAEAVGGERPPDGSLTPLHNTLWAEVPARRSAHSADEGSCGNGVPGPVLGAE
jgi:hypothetical protein